MIYFIILLPIIFIYVLIETILRSKQIDKEYRNELKRLAKDMRAARDKENINNKNK